jgi:hypothetical protein
MSQRKISDSAGFSGCDKIGKEVLPIKTFWVVRRAIHHRVTVLKVKGKTLHRRKKNERF